MAKRITRPSSQGKSTTGKSPSKPVAVTTLVDPVLKRRWQAASQAITAASHEEAKDFDRKWEAVADIVFAEPPLYLAGGFSTDKDFFEKFLQVDCSTGLRKARVARFASPQDIEAFGDTKIDALLDYLEAKAGGPLHGHLPVALDKVRVPVTVDGKDETVTLAIATREQIRAATRGLQAKSATHAKASPRGRSLQEALTSVGLRQVALGIDRGTFDLRGIPWDAATKLGAALARVKLPAPDAPPA